MDDLGLVTFDRYWKAIRVVDSTQVMNGAVPPNACLMVFSPVTWLGTNDARVIVGEVRLSAGVLAQRFVFLRRRPEGWEVSRIETGLQR